MIFCPSRGYCLRAYTSAESARCSSPCAAYYINGSISEERVRWGGGGKRVCVYNRGYFTVGGTGVGGFGFVAKKCDLHLSGEEGQLLVAESLPRLHLKKIGTARHIIQQVSFAFFDAIVEKTCYRYRKCTLWEAR